MNIKTIHNAINLRGLREQTKFATGEKKPKMKGCYCRGCEIFTPIFFNLKGIDLSEAYSYDRAFQGEEERSNFL